MSWDDEAATWDDEPAVRAYSRGAFRSLGEVLADQGVPLDGARVLDFGCGTGLLTAAMAAQAREVVAMAVSGAMLEVLRAKELANVRTVQGELAVLLGTAGPRRRQLRPDHLLLGLCVPRGLPGHRRAPDDSARPCGLFVQWDWELDSRRGRALRVDP